MVLALHTPKTVDLEIVSDQGADRDQGLQRLIDELGASIIHLEKTFQVTSKIAEQTTDFTE